MFFLVACPYSCGVDSVNANNLTQPVGLVSIRINLEFSEVDVDDKMRLRV